VTPAELARLGSLPVRARVIVEGAFAGKHRNLHAGTSMEFTEHKEYAPGDEIRRIDWKAVGRVDRYYVKRFEDETELRTFLVLDASASMGYGQGAMTKLAYAQSLAGALAYLLGQQGDPTGLVLHDEATRQYVPPSTRPGQVREIWRQLEATRPDGRTDIARALGHVGELCDRRSLVVVFSDLLDAEAEDPKPAASAAQGPVVAGLRNLAARGHDVVLFHLLDPDEVELPFQDLSHFEGVEPGDARALLAEPEDLRDAFRRESQAFRDRWRQACVEARVEYRFARTDEAPSEILRQILAGRQRGRS
jgi:uncharacterized protein (DUF58 family)